ncbi:hypothetical protein [Sphingosinicella sp.]|uniref:hypothetical protein n=1 Tax=Sphingosinicella sp. TaxID=1917971 RepID=UPI0040379A63
MIDIFERALGERANVTASDPITTPGTEMWRWCTRFLRDHPRLQTLGWVVCRHNQIDGIRNDALKMKLVVINTDTHTGIVSKQPRNCADKGSAAELLVKNNHESDLGWLFEPEVEDDPISRYDFWYLCVHAGERYVSAEISRPDLIISGTIRNFSERIILCKPGQIPGLRRPEPVPEDFAAIDKPIIIRKQ